ncbi:hypothetical protein HMPREF3038_00832 [Akkermansia sp. KLE1797]|nr:hypothetical protein HMPREF3038_00832 [Akkermansia sp. KLE1797]KXU54514.1 hypothetical protein HMPREF3039_01411 [Akkermansia sp. KLE1798]
MRPAVLHSPVQAFPSGGCRTQVPENAVSYLNGDMSGKSP